jgi:hypothetical protein
MHALLDQEAPGLAKKLESLSPDVRRSVLTNACVYASACLSDPEVPVRGLLESLKKHGTLSKGEVAKASSLAEAADAKYADLQDRGADQEEVLKSFSEARLLSAMAIGFGGTSPKDSADAVYELCKTCDDPSGLIRSIEANIDTQSAQSFK